MSLVYTQTFDLYPNPVFRVFDILFSIQIAVFSKRIQNAKMNLPLKTDYSHQQWKKTFQSYSQKEDNDSTLFRTDDVMAVKNKKPLQLFAMGY